MRRAKLYYLREKVGKQARVAERRWGIEDDLVIATEEAQAVDAEGESVEEAEPEVVEPEETSETDEADEEELQTHRRGARRRRSPAADEEDPEGEGQKAEGS